MEDLFTVTLSVSDGFKVIEALSQAEDLYTKHMNYEHNTKAEREEMREERDIYRWLQELFGEKMQETGTYDY